VPPDRLGGTALVRVDGVVVSRARLFLGAGTIDLEAAPGPRAVALEWPPARGASSGADLLAYADVAPEGGGAIVLERQLFELRPGAPLTLRFAQREGELDQIDLFVVDEGRGAPWSLRYQIDMGGAQPSSGRFFRRLTTLSAIVAGQGAEAERGRLWEAPPETMGAPLGAAPSSAPKPPRKGWGGRAACSGVRDTGEPTMRRSPTSAPDRAALEHDRDPW
jgi:hypothetical protein